VYLPGGMVAEFLQSSFVCQEWYCSEAGGAARKIRYVSGLSVCIDGFHNIILPKLESKKIM